MQTRERETVLASVEHTAEARVGELLVNALFAMEKQISSMRYVIANKYGVGRRTPSDDAEQVSDHLLDATFCRDALESMPIDYSGIVSGSDSNGELTGDEEIAVAEVRKRIVAVLMNLAGTD